MVKVTIMFRGREMAFTEKGREILDRVAIDTQLVAKVTAKPKMEGRDMHMTLSPINEVEQNRVANTMAKDATEEEIKTTVEEQSTIEEN